MNWRKAVRPLIAGFVSLAVCSGATVAVVRLLVASSDFGGWLAASTLDPTLVVAGICVASIVSLWSLWLPARALNAEGGRAVAAVAFSAFAFFVFFFSLIFSLVSAVFPFVALLALVGTSAAGSLIAIGEEGDIVKRPGQIIAISGGVLYLASVMSLLFVSNFLSISDYFSGILAGLVVAAISWPVLPALAGTLRSDRSV